MRSKEEKKTKVTSLRLTEEQHQAIQKQADARNMNLSTYIIDRAVHADSALTPEAMVRIQKLINLAYRYIPALDQEEIDEEVHKLWSLLK